MNTFDKVSLGLFPTPICRLPNMSRELGTNVWIKRDDLCGVALGGNKVRKLEYLLADAKHKGYDLDMTTGQAQSNQLPLSAYTPPPTIEVRKGCCPLALSCEFVCGGKGVSTTYFYVSFTDSAEFPRLLMVYAMPVYQPIQRPMRAAFRIEIYAQLHFPIF